MPTSERIAWPSDPQGWCALFRELDTRFKTTPDSPLHHDHRCIIHNPLERKRSLTRNERCRRCRFLSCEHDPIDMRCPDDEDEARINATEQEGSS